MSGAGRWMAAAVGLALVAGASLGVVADRMVLTEAPDPSPESRQRTGSIWFDCDAPEVTDGSRRSESWRERRVETLRVELGLDADQVEAVSQALASHGGLARTFWGKTRTEYCDLRDSLRSEVRQLLHGEQIERFERRLERIDEKDRQRINGDPGYDAPSSRSGQGDGRGTPEDAGARDDAGGWWH